ncbi:helix-turn-helix domain-containing protein [Acidisoma sp. 7E03]
MSLTLKRLATPSLDHGARNAHSYDGSRPEPLPAAAEGDGARIRQIRRYLGLSQQRLASRSGVSRSAIAQWETGRTGQAQSNLTGVAAALGVSVRYLLTGDDGDAETADEQALLTLYRQIKDAGRLALLRHVKYMLAAASDGPG